MAPKRAAARREPADEPIEATLPGVLIPPSQAAESQREAYWIELLDNPEELRKAVGTTEFFPLLREFPPSVWGDRLSIYVYRLPDEDGMMVKNEAGARKYIKPIIRTPIDEDWIATKHGGGKYLLYLKLDNKASIKETTVRIDGPPKVAAGQTVEIDGKFVPVGTASLQPATPVADQRSDVATIIDANSKAEEKRMEMVTDASKAAIQIVRDQAAAAAKPTAENGIMDKFLTVMIDRMMNPPAAPDPVEAFIKLQGLLQKQNPEPVAEKETDTEAGITLVERLTGKTVADMLKPRAAAAEGNEYGWVGPVMSTVTSFIDRLPTILHETRVAREMEFRRQVYLRTAKPGEAPPAELLANNPPPATGNVNERQPNPPAQPQPNGRLDPSQLVTNIVQTICRGFDTSPDFGHQTASTIDLLFGREIEALGLEKYLADEASLIQYVAGIPALAERSQFATWPKFQNDFLAYTEERWGQDDGGEGNIEQMPAPSNAAPQPVA